MPVVVIAACVIAAFLHSGIAYRSAGQDGAYTVVYDDGGVYKGGMEGGVRCGIGTYVRPDGTEYRGAFRDDRPEGEGVIIDPEGRMRKVTFEGGILTGARWIHPSETGGEREFGEFTVNGTYRGWFIKTGRPGYTPHGNGRMIYRNGSRYSGQWKDGRMHGNGKIEWSDGSYYVGQWVRGKRCGFGTYRWPGGEMYVGQWDENRMCGRGTYYLKNGSVRTSGSTLKPGPLECH